MHPLLKVNNIKKMYGHRIGCTDVSFDLYPGEVMGIVGESGSGKSTAARVITGLLPPTQGQVIFDGAPLPPALKDRSKEQLRELQMIYQMA
ncbi:MAG: ATP-binding cassette domain-containing protein, partial [Tritonibacter mobilis]|nr:ATP-binding cassette domain-containing protein [Tritonibacter mobilis]